MRRELIELILVAVPVAMFIYAVFAAFLLGILIGLGILLAAFAMVSTFLPAGMCGS